MKLKTQSAQIRNLQQLLGLALIGLVLWLAAIGWLPLTSAHAAQGGPRHYDPAKRLAHMQTALNLTAEQVEQIRPILEDGAVERRAVFEKYHGQDRSRMRAEMQKLREETESALGAVLTAEQMAKWQLLRKNRRDQRRQRHSSALRP